MSEPIGCYERTCWCCICRMIERCCKKKTQVQKTTATIGETKLGQVTVQPAHVRTRTWHLIDGKMRYIPDDPPS